MFKTKKPQKQAWPPVAITVDEDGRAFEFSIAEGAKTRMYAGTLDAARTKATELLVDWSRRLRRPLVADVSDPEGRWRVRAEPDGTVLDMAEAVAK